MFGLLDRCRGRRRRNWRRVGVGGLRLWLSSVWLRLRLSGVRLRLSGIRLQLRLSGVRLRLRLFDVRLRLSGVRLRLRACLLWVRAATLLCTPILLSLLSHLNTTRWFCPAALLG